MSSSPINQNSTALFVQRSSLAATALAAMAVVRDGTRKKSVANTYDPKINQFKKWCLDEDGGKYTNDTVTEEKTYRYVFEQLLITHPNTGMIISGRLCQRKGRKRSASIAAAGEESEAGEEEQDDEEEEEEAVDEREGEDTGEGDDVAGEDEEEETEPDFATHILYLKCTVEDCGFLVHSDDQFDPDSLSGTFNQFNKP